jgi:hypothetical protein
MIVSKRINSIVNRRKLQNQLKLLLSLSFMIQDQIHQLLDVILKQEEHIR